MKRMTLYSILSLAACILICSCQSNLSITKRHYTNGYYVDFSKNNKSITENKEENNPIQTKSIVPVLSANAVPNEPVARDNNTRLSEVNVPTASPKVISKISKIKNALTAKPLIATAESRKSPVGFNENVSSQKSIPDSVDRRNDDGAAAALSLLWIVIVVILILWLIGLLAGGFGLGGFINLLLVIALILLILWLLRVI